ncbi:hypothetical protein [Leptospira jelokensis]|uniref:Uncharacterized protein n=1 Tax=Leptospira jelokensis TaxID=2484931 RepID=A0A4Z1A3D6_9LEPT|nr:hypothetical protein [Leptospira jelokensis]TGL59918.1 hypothetical protein EHQ62_16265 [Leptospira jelokensis]
MWLWIILIVVIVLILIYFTFGFYLQTSIPLVEGSLVDVDENLTKLIAKNDYDSFLVIQISHDDEFVQFKYSEEDGLLIDFPLVTDNQKAKTNQILSFCKREALEYEFLNDEEDQQIDIFPKGNQDQLVQIVKSILTEIFGVSEGTKVYFQLQL